MKRFSKVVGLSYDGLLEAGAGTSSDTTEFGARSLVLPAMHRLQSEGMQGIVSRAVYHTRG